MGRLTTIIIGAGEFPLAAVFPPSGGKNCLGGLRFSFALSFLKRKGIKRNAEIYVKQLNRRRRYEIIL